MLLAVVVASGGFAAQLPCAARAVNTSQVLPETNNKLLQFTSAGHVLGFTRAGVMVAAANHMMKVEFVDSRAVDPEADGAVKQGVQIAPPLSRVTYRNIWDGVTVVYEANEGSVIKSTYYINTTEQEAPAGNIRLLYNRPVHLDERGNLVIAYEDGTMVESAPIAWQEIGGQRKQVIVAYVIYGEREVGFSLGDYLSDFPVVIDPALVWNTFLGESGSDVGWGVAVDGSGNVYVVGASSTTWGSPVRAFSGGSDPFVAKLDSSGNLVWNTFLKGTSGLNGWGITVDSSGNVYVIGQSSATWGNPVRAFHVGPQYNACVAKLDSSGNLIWNTFLGSALGNSFGLGIAVDGRGNVYVTGQSGATWGNPLRVFKGIWSDAFVANLDNRGNLIWNTFLGGTGSDIGMDIVVDRSGNIYVTGQSGATWGNPVRAFHVEPYDAFDAFIAKLDNSGNLIWNTFLGGSDVDGGWNIVVDGNENVYVSGYSKWTWGSPVRAITSGNGTSDASVAKLDSNGNLIWNTFLGGWGWDSGRGILVDGSGNVYVFGSSTAAWGNPVQPFTFFGFGYDNAFIAGLDNNGNLIWNTFLGGSGNGGIGMDSSGNVYVSGISHCNWETPVRAYTSGYDAFVAKISTTSPPPASSYDGTAACNYARDYWDKVCSDGYFWTDTYTSTSYPAGSPAPTGGNLEEGIGNDGAHFVSCCIGNEPHVKGGGLDILPRTEEQVTYGKPGAKELGDFLLSSGMAEEKTTVDDLVAGDVINYDFHTDGSWDQVGIYLEDHKVAVHSPSLMSSDWHLMGFQKYRYLHILNRGSSWSMFHHDPQHTGRSAYLGPQTNTVKWTYTTGSSIESSPTIGIDGTIYVGSDDSILYAINPNGSLKWSYATSGYIWSSPSIGSDGTVYMGSSDCNLYAIDPGGSLRWSYNTVNRLFNSPAIGSDGTVYVAPLDGKLYAINPNGTLKWSYATDDQITFSSPAIGKDGTVYIGSDNNTCAINPDGTLKWSYATGGPIESSPAIGSDGTVYVGSNDCKLYAIHPSGNLKWSYITGHWGNSSPAIGNDGTVYVGSVDGKLYAINSNGTLKWSYTTGGGVYSSPAIGSDDTVYGSNDSELYYAINPNGTLKWSYATGHCGSSHPGGVSSPAIGSDGTLYIGSSDGKLYAFGGQLDMIRPATVTNLSAGNATASSLTLTWRASGDDGNVGTASQYDIRYSTAAITEANWGSATQCTGEPVPKAAESSESFIVSGLSPNTTYYFALKVADEEPNWSVLSNVATGGSTGTISNHMPVLLVHGLEVEYGTHSNWSFDPVAAWIALAKTLSGDTSDNVIQVLDTSHVWWKKTNKGVNDFPVYISNYSHETTAETFADIRYYARFLQDEISKIKEETGCEKVDIVAHSMGGLVARAYIENTDFSDNPYGTQYNGDVDHLIMLGTPNHGSPYAILSNLFLDIFKGLAPQQMISGSSFLNTLNSGGSQPGTTDVKYVTFAGNLYECGIIDQLLCAMANAQLTVGPCGICTIFPGIPNDGVVAVESVKLDTDEPYLYYVDHNELHLDTQVCNGVKQVLLGQTVLAEKQHVFTFACPVHVTITDDLGRSISDTGINTIPGASVSIDEVNDLINFYLPPNLIYTICISSYANGSLSFLEQLPLTDTNTLVNIFKNIQLTENTTIILDVIAGSNNRIVKIDFDGNGAVDSQKNPDITAVISTATYDLFTATGNGTVKLSTDSGIMSNLSAISEANLPMTGKPNITFPFGLFSFKIDQIVPGSTVWVTITYPSVLPANMQYWKNQNGNWVNCTSLIQSINGNIMTLKLTDGGLGDTDGLANGIIVDPGGVAISAVPSPTPMPTTSNPLIGTGAPTSHGSSLTGTTTTQPLSLPNIQIQSASLSASKILPGTPVKVIVKVANRGTVNGTTRIKLYVNGEEDSSQSVTVESSGNRHVYFTVNRNQPGTYDVYVGGVQAGTFMIENEIDPNIILLCSCTLILISLALGIVYIMRRRNYDY